MKTERTHGDLTLSRAILTVADRIAALGDRSLANIADVIADEGTKLIRDSECVVSVVPDGDTRTFTVIAGSGAWAAAKVGRTWPSEGTINGRALSTQHPVETEAAALDSSLPSVFSEGGHISIGRVVPIIGSEPLPDGRQVLGALGFWRAGRPFNADERALIDAFARHSGLHLVKFELRRIDKDVRDRLTFANRVSMDLQESLDPREIIARLLKTTLSVVGADRVTLSSIEEDIVTVEATLGPGGETTWIGRSFNSDLINAQPLVRAALQERRPVVGGSMRLDTASPEMVDALAAAHHTLTLPLIHGDSVLAMLVVSRFSDEPFDEDDVQLMQLIGSIASLALRNSRRYEAATQLARTKTDFLNMAAHELRTPVQVISGYLEMIERSAFGEIPDPMRRPMQIVARKSNELISLVENVLEAAKTKPDPPAVLRSTFDLRPEIAEAVNRAQGRAALLEGGIAFESSPEPILVSAGREYVGRVLDNLINNALSYDEGHPSVVIEVRVERAARVLISDTGMGIPEEVRERIFEQFFRISTPPWSNVAGTGLGLYLCRRLATAAGCSLTLVSSTVGKGSVFALDVPLAAGDSRSEMA